MRKISLNFDGAMSSLPAAPQGHRLSHITYSSCPNSDLSVHLILLLTDDVDRHGVAEDSWWRVRSEQLPHRDVRLYKGEQSMRNLLSRYGFQDAGGCVNHKKVEAVYEPITNPVPRVQPQVPKHLIKAIGIPQFYENSGVCWFAAMCTVMFSDPSVSRFVQAYLPANLRVLCDECLHSRTAAHSLRNKLWEEYALGDNIDDSPENDGCNGFSEFTLLCAKQKIPLLRYKEQNGNFVRMTGSVCDKRGTVVPTSDPDTTKPHLLVLRFIDGDHVRFPLLRRFQIAGRCYKLVGFFAGQRKCGHQIGIASSTGSWRDIVIGDADLHKDGIGLVFSTFTGAKWKDSTKWQNAMNVLVHITKFGPRYSQLCNLNFLNPPDTSLDKYQGVKKTGSNSIDLVLKYM